ncbi:MAG TPA: hypothetical protein DIS76_00505 [Rhodospirillaceae bacterium]|nr:hypothetical protein [Rhodospirillaceae bacterium]
MTKTYKILFLGAAAICLASTAAVAGNYNQRNSTWLNDNSARAPQVQSTRAGNPHEDKGMGFNSTLESRTANKEFPAAPRAQDANKITDATTKAGNPHRDPANANSAYYSAQPSDRNETAAKMRLSNRQIRAVQESLNDHGYKVAEDGIWGPQTARAVRSFQANNNLEASGKLNSQTLNTLSASYRNDARMSGKASSTWNASEDVYNDKNWDNTQR